MINSHLTQEQVQAIQANFITKVYGWMTLALVITGLTAVWAAGNETISQMIRSNRLVLFGLIGVQLLIVFGISGAIKRISAQVATLLFLVYSVITGVVLSFIFYAYTGASIASTFFITAGTFGAMSAYGYYTKKDLTSWGRLLFMALIGLIIATIVNIFVASSMLYWISSFAGVIIFVGLTAYDTQKIKQMGLQIAQGDAEMEQKGAIMGALSLYLDFINLFIYLLRILGDRK
ncbi:Bax inhibitor-1/YccA family protein [Aureivirga sp. CE67]|uniref:Bax inhibitor-1/YccA family protein n=1 Tax=Aureivirga sp. CE67 TaxID=1788983 RepID=UPI0018CAC4BF|nr:Bax inhibitor-1/YccA family protein [Aureivirga sp. CE67]